MYQNDNSQFTAFDLLVGDVAADPKIKADRDFLEDQIRFIYLMISLRLEQKLTQAQLAEKVGMKQAAIARIESGKANPSFRTLNRIARVLDKRITLI